MFGSWYIYIGAITTSQKNACMSTNCETKNQQTLWVLATRLASASLAWITVFDQGSHYQTRRESTCRIRKLAVVKAPFFPILSIFGHGSWQNSSPVATNVKRIIAKLGWCYPHIGWYHAPFPEVTPKSFNCHDSSWFLLHVSEHFWWGKPTFRQIYLIYPNIAQPFDNLFGENQILVSFLHFGFGLRGAWGWDPCRSSSWASPVQAGFTGVAQGSADLGLSENRVHQNPVAYHDFPYKNAILVYPIFKHTYFPTWM